MNREWRKLVVDGGPRVGTRVERAEEGRGEDQKSLGDLTGLIKAFVGHNIRVDFYESL